MANGSNVTVFNGRTATAVALILSNLCKVHIYYIMCMVIENSNG